MEPDILCACNHFEAREVELELVGCFDVVGKDLSEVQLQVVGVHDGLHGLVVVSVNGERSEEVLPVLGKNLDVSIRCADCEPLDDAVSDGNVHVHRESEVLSLCAGYFEIDSGLGSSLNDHLGNGHFEED